jgi:hypothetical protein
MRYFFVLWAAWLIACPPAWSGDLKQIELLDGSVITGEVLSMSNGVYTIRSDSVGTVRIDSAQIRAIRAPSGGPVSQGDPALESRVQALQQAMANDPESLGQILALQNDPDFQAALEDPDVLAALQAGDLQALLNHPKIRKLTGNPRLPELQKRLP